MFGAGVRTWEQCALIDRGGSLKAVDAFVAGEAMDFADDQTLYHIFLSYVTALDHSFKSIGSANSAAF